jgi:type II secretory pathway component PulF
MGARVRLAQAYYDMAMLLDAGVPMLRSLDIVIQGRQGYLKRAFTHIRNSLSQGSSLSESMDRHHNVFPEMDRMVIQAGETSGTLGDSLKMLSQWHEFVHKTTRRMMMALGYPFLLLSFAVCVLKLPSVVLGQITIVGYLREVLGLLLFFYMPVLVVAAFVFLRERIPLLMWPLDVLALRVPVFGQAMYHMCICRYAKVFAMLYQAGVPISEATERATRATGNVLVAQRFAGGSESVRRGGAASEGFSARLPAEYRSLWQIGEETGDLDKTAAKIAEIAGDRANFFFTAFASGFPKVVYFIVLAIMAVTVLLFAVQFYSNLYRF